MNISEQYESPKGGREKLIGGKKASKQAKKTQKQQHAIAWGGIGREPRQFRGTANPAANQPEEETHYENSPQNPPFLIKRILIGQERTVKLLKIRS